MRVIELFEAAWPFRNKNKIYSLLIDQTGSGPFDGGCAVFAQALQLKYGGDIVVLVGNTRQDGPISAQHAVISLNGKLIDADGPAAPAEFVQRFVKNELGSGGEITQVRPIKENDLPEAPRDLELAQQIARLL